MFFHKKSSNKEAFDEIAWKEFVRFIAVQKFSEKGDREHEYAPNKVFVEFSYIGVKYNHLLYTIKKENNIPLFVSFWLPETEENKYMDCILINRCQTAGEAIRYITNLSLEKEKTPEKSGVQSNTN